MTNHCHWLFRIPVDHNWLSIAMKELNGRDAHLFRNRFAAEIGV
jgi:hypothetical protein